MGKSILSSKLLDLSMETTIGLANIFPEKENGKITKAYMYHVSKNVTTLSCHHFDVHESI